MSKPIDLDAVREARRNLDRLVRENPELRNRADALAEDFDEIMGDENMTTTPSQFRLSEELLARISRHAKRLERKARVAGVPVKITRTAALRVLLEDALDRAEAADKPRKRQRPT